MRRLSSARWALVLSVCAVLGCGRGEQPPAANLEQEKAALQEQLAAAQAELAALREEYEMFQAGLDESAAELDELLAENQQQQTELKDLRKKLDVALKLLGACRSEAERLRKGAAGDLPAR